MLIKDLNPHALHHLNRRKLQPILRQEADIRTVFVHHSGALSGISPEPAALASLRYTMQSLGWKMPAYHYWIPVEGPEIFQFAPHGWRCYHTGGDANRTGIGVCVQGNKNAQPLSDFQKTSLLALLPALGSELGYDVDAAVSPAWLSWHSEAAAYGGKSKPACPGRHTEAFLRKHFREPK